MITLKMTIKNSMICLMLIAQMMFLFPAHCWADAVPGMIEGENVVYGSAAFNNAGNTTNITTGGPKTIIEYSLFNIDAGSTVNFIQPTADAATLNRIIQPNPSMLNGTLNSNGHIYIINPAGVIFGEGTKVNVNQLIASGLNMSNADFLADHLAFSGGTGDVLNQGEINANSVMLIGNQVTNVGTIHCPEGFVLMASGQEVFLAPENGGILVQVGTLIPNDSANAGPAVKNEGTITASKGTIILAAAGDVYSQVVENVGVLRVAEGTVSAQASQIINEGLIDVSGEVAGNVELTAENRLGQFGTIHADSSEADGGNISLTAGQTVALSSDSVTTANAGNTGDGGQITVFSPDTALFWKGAQIEAKGGSVSGDGGFVEVSGKQHVEIYGSVNASASNGTPGTFLIDPFNMIIQAGSGGTLTTNPFVAGADNDTIGDEDIEGYLNAGTSVTIQTANGGNPLQGDITQNADATIDFTGASPVSLTLYAADDIVLNGGINASGAGSTLDVSLNANSPTGGTPPGNGGVTVNADISTNGGTFSSTGVAFDSSAASITTSGGDITITHTAAAALGGLNASAGNISIVAGGNVTDSDAIVAAQLTVNTSTAAAGGAITLDTSANDADAINLISADGQNITYVDQDEVDIIAINAGTGDVSISAGGDVTDSGSVIADDLSVDTTTAVTGGAILLDTATNDTDSIDLASASGQDITFVDQDGVAIANVDSDSGNIQITAGGSIQLNNVNNVISAGTGNVSLSSAESILVENANNQVRTEIQTSGTVDLQAKAIGTSGFILDISEAASIYLAHNGTADGENVYINNSTSDSITATTAGSNHILTVSAADIDVSYESNGGTLDISGADVGTGNLSIIAAGDVTDSGEIVTAQLSVDTGTAAMGGAITLDTATNDADAINLVSAAGQDITFVDQDEVDIVLLNAGTGNANITAGGDVTDSGAVVAAQLTVDTGSAASGGAITLDSAANSIDRIDLVSASGQDITYIDQDGVEIVALNADSANIIVTAGDIITDGTTGQIIADALTVKTLNDAGADIELNNGHNVSSIDLRARNAADSAVANGAVTFANQGGSGTLELSRIETGSTVDIEADDISGVDINADGLITLTTNTGGILDTDSSIDVTSSANLALHSFGDIGSEADPIQTDVSGLIASSAAGDIYVAESDIVEIFNLDAADTQGDIIVTSGDMTISGSVVAGNSISLTASKPSQDAVINQTGGTLHVTKLDGTGILQLTQDVDLDIQGYSFTNQSNTNLVLDSVYGSVFVDWTNPANAADQWNSIGAFAQGNIDLRGNDIPLITLSEVLSDSGDITVYSYNSGINITDQVSSPAGTIIIAAINQISFMNGSLDAASVYIQSVTQSILDADSIEGTDIFANNLYIWSGDAVGSLANPIDTEVAALQINQGNNAYISQAGDINLTGISLTNAFSLEAGGNVTDTSPISVAQLSIDTSGAASGGIILLDNTSNDADTINLVSAAGQDITFIDQDEVIIAGLNAGGNANITAGGDVTDSGAVVAAQLSVNTSAAAVGGVIALDTAANDADSINFVSAAGQNITFVDQDGVDIVNLDAGANNVNITAGGDVTDSGEIIASQLAVDTSAAAAGGAITLNTATNDVDGISLVSADGQNITFVDQDALNVVLVNAGTGDVYLTAGGSVTDSGVITADLLAVDTSSALSGGVIDLFEYPDLHAVGTIDFICADGQSIRYAGQGDLEILNLNAGTGNAWIYQFGSVNDGTAGTITAANLNIYTYNDPGGDILLDNVNAHNVDRIDMRSFNAAINATADGTITFENQGDLEISQVTTTGNANLIASGTITDAAGGIINADSLTVKTKNDAGADILLDNGYSINTIDLQARNAADSAEAAGSIVFNNSTNIDIAGLRTGSNANLNVSGSVSNSGEIAVADLNINTTGAASGGAITLDVASNDADRIYLVSANNQDITFIDQDEVDILSLNAGTGNASVTAGGDVTDTGQIIASELSVDAGGAVILDTVSNDADSINLVSAASQDIIFADQDGVDIITLNAGGNASVIARGDVTDSGTVSAAQLTVDTSAAAAGGAITLDTATNDVDGINFTSAAGQNIAFVDQDGVDVVSLDAGTNNVSITAGGDVTDSGEIIAAQLTVDTSAAAAEGAITLDTATNDVDGINFTSAAGQDITFVDQDALNVVLANAGTGNVTITAGGSVTDSGLITANVLTIDTSSATTGGYIDLNQYPALHNVQAIDLTCRDGEVIMFIGQNDLEILNLNAGTGNTWIYQFGSIDDGSAGMITAGELSVYTFSDAGGNILLDNPGSHNIDEIYLQSWDSALMNISSGMITFANQGDLDMLNVSTLGDIEVSTTGAVNNGYIQGDNLILTAGAAIGSESNPIATEVASLTAASGDGGIYITETDGLTAGSLNANNGNIQFTTLSGDAVFSSLETTGTAPRGNIEVSVDGSLRITNSVSATGGVKLVAENGSVTSDGSQLDIPVTGYSDENAGIGVELAGGTGLAAIIIQSHEDLILGSNAVLTANGNYYGIDYDNRSGANLKNDPPNNGDPSDIGIQLAAGLGGVTPNLNALLEIGSDAIHFEQGEGTLVLDSTHTVGFTPAFESYLQTDSTIARIEAVSRITTTSNDLQQLSGLGGYSLRLPAANQSTVNWVFINDSLLGPILNYVLRGLPEGAALTDLASVLSFIEANANESYHIQPEEILPTEDFTPVNLEALIAWVRERFGDDFTVYFDREYAMDMMATNMFPYKSALELSELETFINDEVPETFFRYAMNTNPDQELTPELYASMVMESPMTAADKQKAVAWLDAFGKSFAILTSDTGEYAEFVYDADEALAYFQTYYMEQIVAKYQQADEGDLATVIETFFINVFKEMG